MVLVMEEAQDSADDDSAPAGEPCRRVPARVTPPLARAQPIQPRLPTNLKLHAASDSQ